MTGHLKPAHEKVKENVRTDTKGSKAVAPISRFSVTDGQLMARSLPAQ